MIDQDPDASAKPSDPPQGLNDIPRLVKSARRYAQGFDFGTEATDETEQLTNAVRVLSDAVMILANVTSLLIMSATQGPEAGAAADPGAARGMAQGVEGADGNEEDAGRERHFKVTRERMTSGAKSSGMTSIPKRFSAPGLNHHGAACQAAVEIATDLRISKGSREYLFSVVEFSEAEPNVDGRVLYVNLETKRLAVIVDADSGKVRVEDVEG